MPAPAIAQGVRELKLVTDWTESYAGAAGQRGALGAIDRRNVGRASQGHGLPRRYSVRAFETFDAVSAGVADMYHSDEDYFAGKSPALNFFATVPYGMTADELCSWIYFGGGQALWDEVDAQFNIKPLMATNTGVQMGGWFTKEINRPEDYKGLRYRMPELGAEVLRRMGATVVTTPGGEIVDRAQIRRDRCRRMDRTLDGHRAWSR